MRLSNSLEALQANYNRGFQFIELDFNWTSDGELVLIHDWQESLARLFDAVPGNYTLKEFMQFTMLHGLTQLALDQLAQWLKEHANVYIVTDVKRDNLKALAKIRESFPELIMRFIPQIYFFEEYYPVRTMEYKYIILTLYRSVYSDQEVIEFVRKNKVIAVTMPQYRALTNLPLQLKKINVPTYVHTVNDVSLQRKLNKSGIFGVYTDCLYPQ